jgi:predicted deacylase
VKVGNIEGQSGKKVTGRLWVGQTTSQIPVELPVTIVMGRRSGPTLVVSGGVHGREILGVLGVGKVLRDLDPGQMSGNLVAVPLANMSSFEFGYRMSLWDEENLEDAGCGAADGSLTERLAHRLCHEVVLKGDAYIELHSSRAESLVWYTIYFANVAGAAPAVEAASKEMALAFGLEQVWESSPWPAPLKEAAMREGVPAIMPEIGGGADFFRNGRRQIADCARGIINVMKLMGILPGEIETEAKSATIWDGHTEVFNDGTGGLVLLECQRGDRVNKGDTFAVKYDPTTGEEMSRIIAPADGTVLNTGLVWPLCRGGSFLGVLGDKTEDIDLTDHVWTFK